MAEGEAIVQDYVSVKEASQRYGLSESHLRLLLRKGAIAGRRVIREWLVEVGSLEAYIKDRPKPGPKGD